MGVCCWIVHTFSAFAKLTSPCGFVCLLYTSFLSLKYQILSPDSAWAWPRLESILNYSRVSIDRLFGETEAVARILNLKREREQVAFGSFLSRLPLGRLYSR